ncbi:MAG: C40 family peptidase [Treponema sp.]|nr:C40 family peptidase [Treponema sp.]
MKQRPYRISTSSLQVIAETLKESSISTPCIYRYLLKEFNGTPYKWGGSSLTGSDCSGSVCAALSYATGHFIRVTADDLYANLFTKPLTYNFGTKTPISAAFFLDSAEKAVHVAGLCGISANGVWQFMNVSSSERSKKGTFRTTDELMLMYPHLKMELRALREDYEYGHI